MDGAFRGADRSTPPRSFQTPFITFAPHRPTRHFCSTPHLTSPYCTTPSATPSHHAARRHPTATNFSPTALPTTTRNLPTLRFHVRAHHPSPPPPPPPHRTQNVLGKADGAQVAQGPSPRASTRLSSKSSQQLLLFPSAIAPADAAAPAAAPAASSCAAASPSTGKRAKKPTGPAAPKRPKRELKP